MYKQGDIVLVPFPYNEDLTIAKKRPVIIISKNSINKNSFIGAKITSAIRNDDFSFPLFKIDLDFELTKSSEIRTNEIFTINKTLVIKKLGNLKRSGLEKVIPMIIDNFEIE